jgi:DNA-binding transcriptional ArsR family regulator
MVTYVFGVEDLARMRFAVSPMWELSRSLVALRDPSTAALHVPWLRGLSGRLGDLDLRRAVELVPARDYMPDFLTPPPAGPLGDIEQGLEALRATPAAQIREDMLRFRRSHRAIKLTQPWLDHPRRELNRLAATLTGFWERAHAPHWPRLRALLEADIAHRARRLADLGPAGLFADLHHSVTWHGDHLTIDMAFQTTVDLRGRGLLVVPSVFSWERPAAVTADPWQPTLIYPARGVATLWEERTAGPAGLARVLGRTRAAILHALEAPRSTTELARRIELTPGGASQHLAALRDAGLVTGRREGREVLYVRTPVADALVTGGG